MSRSNQLAGLITATPTATLDTINEINTSLNNDANLSTTLTNSINGKASKSGDTFTGALNVNTSTEDMAVFTGGVGTLTLRHGIDLEFNRNDITYVTNNNASGSLQFRTGGQNNRLHIDSAGKVGIGTVSPVANLHIQTETDETDEGADVALTLGSNTTGKMRMYFGVNDAGNYTYIGSVESGTAYRHLALQPNGGNVGVGTTSASSFDSAGNQLVVGSGTGHQGLTINAGSSSTGVIHFADGTTGNESYRGYIYYPHNSDQMEFGTAASTRMTIDSSGNVGIGTASPVGDLHISESGASEVRVQVTNSNTGQTASDGFAIVLDADATNQYFWNYESRNMIFGTSGSTKMTIDSSGKVGIGESSPDYPLHVASSESVGGATVLKVESKKNGVHDGTMATLMLTGDTIVNDYGVGSVAFRNTGRSDALVGEITCAKSGGNNDGAKLNWRNRNESGVLAVRFSISDGGNFSGSGSADISDERLKENIKPVTDALEKIKAVKGRTFNWKEEASMPSGTNYGLIAQEVETILPELVHSEDGIRVFDKDGNLKVDEDGALSSEKGETDEYSKSVTMSGLIPILVEAVKELSTKVTALENAS